MGQGFGMTKQLKIPGRIRLFGKGRRVVDDFLGQRAKIGTGEKAGHLF